jgi:hypothetical protein
MGCAGCSIPSQDACVVNVTHGSSPKIQSLVLQQSFSASTDLAVGNEAPKERRVVEMR